MSGSPHKTDVLAFGPHPDDVELGVGATLALHAQRGFRVSIVDLTAGELSTNGDPQTRQREALDAAEILGVQHRENLGLPDGHVGVSEEQVWIVAQCLRTLRPQVVLYPVGPDRHPDHEASEHLIRRALFLAGLERYETEDCHRLPSFRPLKAYGYLLHAQRIPDAVIDVSAVYDSKRRALSSFASQFGKGDKVTFINEPTFLGMMEARDRYFGGLIGAEYGEGLISDSPLSIANLVHSL